MGTNDDYIEAVSKTDLLRVIVALSTEVYALADRQRATEEALPGGGGHIELEDVVADSRRDELREGSLERRPKLIGGRRRNP